jgi:hypothetical protein
MSVGGAQLTFMAELPSFIRAKEGGPGADADVCKAAVACDGNR